MPKEVIKQGGYSVTVGWSKEGTAQVGVSLGSKFTFVNDDEKEIYNSLFFTFGNRQEINSLIKNLRKARDSTFGRDE